MPPVPEPFPRPLPPRRPFDAVADWIRWAGPARLAVSAGSMLVVAAGAFWLLRAPAPDVEAALPHASAAPSSLSATLPPPDPLVSAGMGPAPSSVPVTSVPTVAPPAEAVVHVAGAVIAPGVHRVDPGARVADAVAAAGGPAADADLDALNLAAPLVDGQRVYIPRVGEVDPATVPAGGAPPVVGTGEAAPTQPPGPVDLNRATAAELEALPGVGPATAAAIVDDRDRNGPFASVDDLDRVSGIGPAKLERLRGLVTV